MPVMTVTKPLRDRHNGHFGGGQANWRGQHMLPFDQRGEPCLTPELRRFPVFARHASTTTESC